MVTKGLTEQKRIMPVFLFILVINTGIFAQVLPTQIPQGMELYAQNEQLALYFDPLTTQIGVADISTGAFWLSNPVEPEGNKTSRFADLFILYYEAPNLSNASKGSYKDSVLLNQYTYTPIPGGLRVHYTLGDPYKDLRSLVPPLISEKRLGETILTSNVLMEEEKKAVLLAYTPFVLERDPSVPDKEATLQYRTHGWQFWKKKSDIDMSDISVLERQLFGWYRFAPLLPEGREKQAELDSLWMDLERAREGGNKAGIDKIASKLRLKKLIHNEGRGKILMKILDLYKGTFEGDGSVKYINGLRKDIKGPEDLRPTDFTCFIDRPSYFLHETSKIELAELNRIFIKAGYGIEDLRHDNFVNHLDPPLPSPDSFSLTLEYRLEDDQLLVSIPAGGVIYPNKVPQDYTIDFEAPSPDEAIVYHTKNNLYSSPVFKIQLLRYFGCARVDTDGYIFVPNGSGGIIDFNPSTLGLGAYNQPVYGRDSSLTTDMDVPYTEVLSPMPVFGLKNGTDALFAIVEKGDEILEIRSELCSQALPYNIVYPTFTYTNRSVISSKMKGLESTITMIPPASYEGEIRIRYFFLSDEKANYSGMANLYRSYLIDRYELVLETTTDQYPLFMDVIGSIYHKESTGLYPRDLTKTLTDYEQLLQMAEVLSSTGIARQYIRYLGWMQGGMEHEYPASCPRNDKLGSKGEFIELDEQLSSLNGILYPDSAFLYVMHNSIFDGFSALYHSARLITRQPAQIPSYNPVSFQEEGSWGNVLSPKKVPDLIRSFMGHYGNYAIPRLSLADLGRNIHSDFSSKLGGYVDRNKSYQINKAQLEKLDADLDLMMNAGNVYSLPYAQAMTNLPLGTTGFRMITRDIPFYQMVLHGLVPYAGTPINLASDPESHFLKTIEAGASPNFILAKNDEIISGVGSYYHYLTSVSFDAWKDRVVDYYKRGATVLSALGNEMILDHRWLTKDLVRVGYSGGASVYVNYGADDSVDGIFIPGRDFIMLRDGTE